MPGRRSLPAQKCLHQRKINGTTTGKTLANVGGEKVHSRACTEHPAALPDLLRCGIAVDGERFVDHVLAPEAHVRGAEMEVLAMLGSGRARRCCNRYFLASSSRERGSSSREDLERMV